MLDILKSSFNLTLAQQEPPKHADIVVSVMLRKVVMVSIDSRKRKKLHERR